MGNVCHLQVLAQSNLVLQGYIDDALGNDTYGADQNYTLATAAVLGSYAQVQQELIAGDVSILANYLLTYPANNITGNLTVFEEVSGIVRRCEIHGSC